MAPFLSVREAADLTGKSLSSIRRIIYPIIHDEDHPDRSHILPTVEEVTALRMKGENFAWRLSDELLRREIKPDSRHNDDTSKMYGKLLSPDQAALVSMLRRELDIKNQQISQQGELIAKHIQLVNGLSERLREGNVLIASLQQRLALTDGRIVVQEPTTTKRTSSASNPKASKIHAKQVKPKRSFLSRLFW